MMMMREQPGIFEYGGTPQSLGTPPPKSKKPHNAPMSHKELPSTIQTAHIIG
jgi:hypothetical protein